MSKFKNCIFCGEEIENLLLADFCSCRCKYLYMQDVNPKKALSLMNIPPLYHCVSQKDWSDKGKVLEAFKDDPCNVFLFGACGSGKTYLAATFVKHWANKFIYSKGFDIDFVSSFKVLLEIKQTYQNKRFSESEIIEKYSNIGLLVIDDLGSENVTDWSISSLYQIIYNRINFLKPTIITTNKTIDELSQWDDRLSSRFASFKIFNLGNRDRRVEQ